MKYTAIDWHKKYSFAYTVDEGGKRVKEGKILGNEAAGFAAYFEDLEGPSKVIHEACWNWGKLREILEGIENVEEIVLAHPHKTRLIAEAQIKTDRLDAQALAVLLRGDLVARVHVPKKEARDWKVQLRQRLAWARLRTVVRNRIHALVDRQHQLKLPSCSDFFGTRGMKGLRELQLEGSDARVLTQHLELHDLLQKQIKESEKIIAEHNENNEMVQCLMSLPGMGNILSSVVAHEIDTIERFARSEKLCAYAGLVPTTHSSGGKTYHGRLLPWCNKWLRWAFIEASWVAVGCDGYFGELYTRHRARGKAANTAITIVARRMCQIAWSMLQENRNFQPHRQKNFPGCSQRGLKVAMKP